MGTLLWPSSVGQRSILGHWGGDRRQKRFPVWTVQRLLGWVTRGLSWLQVGLEIWHS